jgi:hypothetical protein
VWDCPTILNMAKTELNLNRGFNPLKQIGMAVKYDWHDWITRPVTRILACHPSSFENSIHIGDSSFSYHYPPTHSHRLVDWLTARQFKILFKKLRQREEFKMNLVNHPPGIFTEHNLPADPACPYHSKCISAEKLLVKKGWGDDQVKADMASCNGTLGHISLPLHTPANMATIFKGFSTQCAATYLRHFDIFARDAQRELVQAAILGIKQTIWPVQYRAEPTFMTSDHGTESTSVYPFIDWLHEYTD